METYIIRIYRSEEEDPGRSVGIVEDVERGRTKKFSGAQELLKILKLATRRARAGKKT